MARYAQGTSVSVERSQAEATQIIKREGGDLITHGWADEWTHVVSFRWRGRVYRFTIAIPRTWDDVPQKKPAYHYGEPDQRILDQEHRRRWRVVVALQLKPLFELSREDPVAAEQMLLHHLMIDAGGRTVGDIMEHSAMSRESGKITELTAGDFEQMFALGPGEV